MGAEEVGLLVIEQVLLDGLLNLLGHAPQEGVEVVGLHLARLDHPAHEFVVDPVLRGPRMGRQKIPDDLGAKLEKERPSTRRVMTNSPALGLRKFSTKSRFVDLVGGQLVERLLRGVDEEGGVGLIQNEADLGHDVLDQCPCSLGSVVVAEAQPSSGFQDTEALSHRCLHRASSRRWSCPVHR